MRYLVPILLIFLISCGESTNNGFQLSELGPRQEVSAESLDYFTLEDYFESNRVLRHLTDSIVNSLSPAEQLSQLIIAAYGHEHGPDKAELQGLIAKHQIGGVAVFRQRQDPAPIISRMQAVSDENKGLPLLFAIDGEPSLMASRFRFKSAPTFRTTNSLQDAQSVRETAMNISDYLLERGISYNFAPVCDLGINREVIGNRAFGTEPGYIKEAATAFIKESQEMGVVATAKHFPGHGSVSGDTHKGIVKIKGTPAELPIFQRVIDKGVISIMVAHIVVEDPKIYDTEGLPASLSPNTVNLLRKRMDFKGIIITDALDMGALDEYQNPGWMALKAGCDLILMPADPAGLIRMAVQEMNTDSDFREQVQESVKRIIRLKICLGLFAEGVQ